MSINTSPSIQICSNGTFIFKNCQYRVNFSENKSLSSLESQEILEKIKVLLESHLKKLSDLSYVKIKKETLHLDEQEIQLSPAEQELFKEIQIIVNQALTIPDGIDPPDKDLNDLPLPLFAKLDKNSKNENQTPFFWPPKNLKQQIAQSAKNIQEFAVDLKQDATDESFIILEELESHLKKIKTFQKSNFINYLTWGKEFYKEKLENCEDIPLFFKQEFQEFLQQIQQAYSWLGVQKTLKKCIKKAFDDQVLHLLFSQNACGLKRQLGQNFLHLYQAKRPAALQARLRTIDRLYTLLMKDQTLTKEDQESLQILWHTLHSILDPLFISPLKNRVKASYSIPSYSIFEKIRKAVSLIFAAIKQFFISQHTWKEAQNAPDYLFAEHCDFQNHLLVREEAIRQESVFELLTSKETYLGYLKSQQPLPKQLIKEIQAEITSHKKHHQDKVWEPSSELNNRLLNSQKRNKKRKKTANREKMYTPALINSHIHQVTTETDSWIIHRSASITDKFDGTTNIRELREKLMDEWKEKIPADSFEEFSSLASKYLKKHWNLDFYLALDRIEKRQKVLEDQMVQLIAHQVKAHILDIVDPSRITLPRLMRTIQITQIGLLNPFNKSKERSGLVISERNQMLDMAMIFEKFNGKKIAFKDVPAPFMDGKTIYLPLSFFNDSESEELFSNFDSEKTFKLSCAFFNISVESGKRKEKEQKAINKVALQQIEKNLIAIQTFIEKYPNKKAVLKNPLTVLFHQFKEIEAKLAKGEANYAIAQDLVLLEHNMQGLVGINCSDGNHRTGYLIAKLVAQCIEHEVDQKEGWTQKEKKALKQKLKRDLMDSEGLASQITYHNTGHTLLKIRERNMIGINEGEGFSGDLIRLGHCLLQSSHS